MILTAGCTTTSPPDSVADVAPAGGPPPSGFWLSGCQSRAAAFHVPAPLHPGGAPPGWEPEATKASSWIFLEFWACDRLNMTPFERPVAFVLEGHTHFSHPPQCRGTAVTAVLHAVWVNDTEVASALAFHFAMPALPGLVGWDAADLAGTTDERWRWRPSGHDDSSEVAFPRMAGEGSSGHGNNRWVWYDDAHDDVRVLDVARSFERDAVETAVSRGALEPPALGAETGLTVVGQGAVYNQARGEGRVSFFGDAPCPDSA